jgi:hypothetical protein
MQSHTGGCHCGAVRFSFEAPARVLAHECNCTICAKSGYLHLIVPAVRFNLLSGSESLREYRFGSGAARHLFCSRCGIKSFYVPRSNPDGYSINLRCVDEGSLEALEVEAFDGRNWELNAASLAHLSVE